MCPGSLTERFIACHLALSEALQTWHVSAPRWPCRDAQPLAWGPGVVLALSQQRTAFERSLLASGALSWRLRELSRAKLEPFKGRAFSGWRWLRDQAKLRSVTVPSGQDEDFAKEELEALRSKESSAESSAVLCRAQVDPSSHRDALNAAGETLRWWDQALHDAFWPVSPARRRPQRSSLQDRNTTGTSLGSLESTLKQLEFEVFGRVFFDIGCFWRL